MRAVDGSVEPLAGLRAGGPVEVLDVDLVAGVHGDAGLAGLVQAEQELAREDVLGSSRLGVLVVDIGEELAALLALELVAFA